MIILIDFIMKKIKIISLLLVSIFAISSCDFKVIDWYPIALQVYVESSETGEDLLNPASDMFLGRNAELEYEGERYPLVLNSVVTKEASPRFEGFLLKCRDGKYYLYFGELDGGKGYNTKFTIHWNNNMPEDVIHLRRRVNYSLVKATNKWQLNSKKTDFPIVIKKSTQFSLP